MASNSAHAEDEVQKLMNCKMLLPTKQPKWISVSNYE